MGTCRPDSRHSAHRCLLDHPHRRRPRVRWWRNGRSDHHFDPSDLLIAFFWLAQANAWFIRTTKEADRASGMTT